MPAQRSLLSVFTTGFSLARKANLFRMSGFRRAFVSSYFLYKRFYEDPFLALIDQKPELFRNGDILDIGANIGYTSCLFSKPLRPESKIYAFEPDLFNFDLLQEVIRRKNLSRTVVPIQAAVGACDGNVEFWHNDRHHGDHRVVTTQFRNFRPDPARISVVPVVTIDNFVESRGVHTISFIKIDVQGYELAVCEGMKQTLARFPGAVIAFEYAPDALIELGFDPTMLLDFFERRGYLIHGVSPPSVECLSDRSMINELAAKRGYIDLLCLRRKLV
jgi:FkbM family methyltransferase